MSRTTSLAPAAITVELSAPRLAAIRAPKASEILASQLRKHILDGSLADGKSLPAERDLVDQTGLSRGAVRQALRILQTEGLVETRTGRFGGSIVKRPSEDALANFLGLFIEGRSIPLLSLLEFRQVVGGPMATLAAKNRTDFDIEQLQQIGKRMEAALDDLPRYFSENVNWHIAMATATHNELLKSVITAVSGLIFKVSAVENFASTEIRNVAVHAHARILDAVIRQDAATASRRMSRHLEALTADMQAFSAATGPLR